MEKKPYLYYALFLTFSVLLVFHLPPLSFNIPLTPHFAIFVLYSFYFIPMILYFWINGLKDIFITIFSLFYKDKIRKNYSIFRRKPLVDVLYCCYNDFDWNSCASALRLSYPNYRLVILDDSTEPEVKKTIDEFAELFKVKVVRRKNRAGFKAGAINNWVRKSKAEYYVIMDSDEKLPPDFIEKVLPYFCNKIAFVQTRHIATRARTKFSKILSHGVDSHWRHYQNVKNTYGFVMCLGHGFIFSKKAWKIAGGFPEIVAEDLGFAVNCRLKGLYGYFCSEVVCEETFPQDYLTFKKRHYRWAQGNAEFIKKYTKKILFGDISWIEKIDLLLAVYNLPMSLLFFLFVIINVVIFPAFDWKPAFPLYFVIITVLTLFAPLFPMFIDSIRNPLFFIRFALYSMASYGSLLVASVKSILFFLMGKKPFFLVTSKKAKTISIVEALLLNVEEILFGLFLFCISLFTQDYYGSILLIIPALITPIISVIGTKY